MRYIILVVLLCPFMAALSFAKTDDDYISPCDQQGGQKTDSCNFFLTSKEILANRKGHARHGIDTLYPSGNSIKLLVNGNKFFYSLYEDIAKTKKGDFIWGTLWDVNANVYLNPDPGNILKSKETTLVRMLEKAIERGVQVRVLVNYNIYNTLAGVNFCRPLNQKSGEVVCSPDNRHNSVFGSLHQKSWVIQRDNNTVAYLGSMDVAAGRYDDFNHDKSLKWKMQPKFTQDYDGWTGGMLKVEGNAVLGIARHLYQEFMDPVNPYLNYHFKPFLWPNPVIKASSKSTSQLQLLLTASPLAAYKHKYYSNWAPEGETTILEDTAMLCFCIVSLSCNFLH